jgi:hypothetical protein
MSIPGRDSDCWIVLKPMMVDRYVSSFSASAIIRVRRHYESTSHFVTCLEEVADKLVFLTLPQTSDNSCHGTSVIGVEMLAGP